MRVKTLKAAALVAVAGTILQFGACLSLNQWPQGAGSPVAVDQVLHSGAALDQFGTGGAGG